MSILPFVSSSDRLDSLKYAIKKRAPYIVDRFWAMVKKNAALDATFFASCHGEEGERESADAVLYSALADYASTMLPADEMADILYEVAQYVTHCEVAQASMLEPDEEAAVWEAWDIIDQAAETQAHYDMWRNEY